jgi:hypothetical protein
MIAALYVQTGGCYYGLDGVDPWDKARDARQYTGPHPVVAHPPCERWGRYWGGGPSVKVPRKMGDDGGCFKSAINAVRAYGGILEHPEGSHAWRAFHLNTPPRHGGWVVADWVGGWTCCVEQGAYGHRARKATWLYARGVELPSLLWGKNPGPFVRLEPGHRSTAEGQLKRSAAPPIERISAFERIGTPLPFRDLLLGIARTAIPTAEAA